MEKQEVLEKIIYYLTKQKPEVFYEIKKGKYFINISEIENVIGRQTRHSFSNENENYEESIKLTMDNYMNKQINYQELKNELARIMYNESNKIDTKISSISFIPDKRKIIEEHVKQNLLLLEQELFKAGLRLTDINIDFYFTNYMIFVNKFHRGCSELFEIKSSIPTIESYTDFMCREKVLESIVKEHYTFVKTKLDKEYEKTDKKKKKEYYSELKKNFQCMTKEELYIPLEKIWNIKLSLDVLYYIPVKESKLTSFYYVVDKHKVNHDLKIDPYLYNTVNIFQQLYTEEAVREFRTFYYHVFDTNDYKKEFVTVLKNKGAWSTVRNLFINLCIVSNTYIFGELLRSWTKDKKFYDDAKYDKSYSTYINNDIISQKIKSGIETQRQMDDFIVQCNIFDRKEDLDQDFVEKIQEVMYMLFDNFNRTKCVEENDENN